MAQRRAQLALLTSLLTPVMGVEMLTQASARPWQIDAPRLTYDDGVTSAHSGFVVHTSDGWQLHGNALRYDQVAGDCYGHGDILLVIPGADGPGLRLEAEWIGFRQPGDPQQRRAEATNVRVWLGNGARLHCDHVDIDHERIVLSGVRGDSGHGGILGLAMSELVIGPRTRPAADRDGIERHVADITIWHPRLKILGLPIMYLPVLYRDFRLDYPWTRYEAGR
ncbi:MAG: hypothetical protein ACYTF0_08595, partial [Planctomycetota bacterium]